MTAGRAARAEPCPFRAQIPEGRFAQNEKASECFHSEASRLVRLAGIEPTTPWFVAKYSIQLSYSR